MISKQLSYKNVLQYHLLLICFCFVRPPKINFLCITVLHGPQIANRQNSERERNCHDRIIMTPSARAARPAVIPHHFLLRAVSCLPLRTYSSTLSAVLPGSTILYSLESCCNESVEHVGSNFHCLLNVTNVRFIASIIAEMHVCWS